MISIFNNTHNLREAGKFITHLKTRIRDNSEHLNGLNDTIKQMINAFAEDPFLMVGLISPLCDDDQSSSHCEQSSSHSDQSSTHCPNDREDAKDKNPNTTGTTKIKDWVETIIGLLNWGGNGGGGDSSIPIYNTRSPIHMIWSMINSFINGTISKEFDGMTPYIQFTKYIDGFIGYIYDNIADIPWWICESFLSVLLIVSIYSIFRILPFLRKMDRFSIVYSVPDTTLIRLISKIYQNPNTPQQPQQLTWLHAQIPGNSHMISPGDTHMIWFYTLRTFYKTDELVKVAKMLSLRLKCIKGLLITDYVLLQHTLLGVGLRSHLNHVRLAVLARVATRHFDPRINNYIYGFFNILVYSGLGLVVWYNLTPEHPPDLGFFRGASLEPFKDPASVVEGYKRVSYLITKDIVDTVITTYQNDRLFNKILNDSSITLIEDKLCTILNVDSLNGCSRDIAACVGAGIMTAVFITSNLMVPGTTGVIQ